MVVGDVPGAGRLGRGDRRRVAAPAPGTSRSGVADRRRVARPDSVQSGKSGTPAGSAPGRAVPPVIGQIVLVATPIGNLGDLTVRAREALESADAICCEDTRRTRKLLSHYGIRGKRLIAVHEHNEADVSPGVAAMAKNGEAVVVVSDAGMPALSDPGRILVRIAVEEGAAVTVLPGPDSAAAALAISGMDGSRFSFEGFLPVRGAKRKGRLESIAADQRTTILFEAPHRAKRTLSDLASLCDAGRQIVVARELTKVHEEVLRGTVGEVQEKIGDMDPKGEMVFVLEGQRGSGVAVEDAELQRRLGELLDRGVALSAAARAIAAERGVPRSRAYSLALALAKEPGARRG